MNDENHRLLDLWARPWGHVYRGPQRHLFPNPVINQVLPYAIVHAALFQALLSVSATRWSLACGCIDEVALRQQQTAIRLHAESSPDEQSASSDANLLAALAITSNQVAQGKLLASGLHMKGISHLVRLRGGPQYLGMGGVLANLVMYADHKEAVFHDQQPIWEMMLPSLQISSSFKAKLGGGFRAMQGGQDIDAELLTAIQDTCQLTEMLSLDIRGKVPVRELNAVGYLSAVVEYQLAHLNALYHGTATRSECVCLALLLFDHVVLRNEGSITPDLRKVEFQFWSTFHVAQARGCWDFADAGSLVWLILTGLVVLVRADCPWLSIALEEIDKACISLDFPCWDVVKKEILDRFLWSDIAGSVSQYLATARYCKVLSAARSHRTNRLNEGHERHLIHTCSACHR